MEDSMLMVSPFTYRNYSLFGVFDGHGGNSQVILGPEVALYVQKKFATELERNSNLRKGNF
jgi:serine/threonine protein phosphatase PrpC